MGRQLYQSQYILNKCFQNKENILRVSYNNAQDYLNAIFDTSKDAIRVNIDGGVGVLPTVFDVEDLPAHALNGQLCPVYVSDESTLDFYIWLDLIGGWVPAGSTKIGHTIDDDEKNAVEWVTEHLDQLKEIIDFSYIVHVEDVKLSRTSRVVVVQGQSQDIDDDLDGDGDTTTPYRIDIAGYVLAVATYQDSDSIAPDRYYTKITYETNSGGLGNSHIFLQQDEFNYFADLTNEKNIIRIYYLTNATTSPIKRMRLILHEDGTVTDTDGVNYPVYDIDDTDGDESTEYCIYVGGYVLGVETFASNEALVPDKCYIKMIYESNGVRAGRSRIYLDDDTYQRCASLQEGKNIMDLYYFHTVFPGSVTISETEVKFPSENAEYVMIDGDGNVHNIADTENKDGDEATHIKMTFSGYVLDMDGYYTENDKIKKRLIIKMSYNYGIDTTDIYVDKEYYDHVSSLGNGRNVVSVYTVGAGLSIDANKIQEVDSVLDGTSMKPIQNKTVKEALDSLTTEIQLLKNRIAELEG